MNYCDVLNIVNGKLMCGSIKKQIKNIQIDSRKVKRNDLFIALIGKNHDSHNYIKQVLKHKPSCIIVCKKIDIKTKVPIILVEDTNDSLIKLGTFFKNKYNVPVVAITGSIGKTTTKELINDILSKKYKVLKSEKNYNNHIGIPLTLFKLNKSYDICVLEMGMNHLKEISVLSKMARPDVGVITNIGSAHIGNLGNQKNIFKAKMEIVDGMDDGLLIVNGKDKYLKKVKYFNTFKCGIDLCPYNIKINDKVSFDLIINNKNYHFIYNSNNISLIMNFVLAIKVGLLFNINVEDIKEVVKNYQMPKERMNVYVKNNIKIINDCYNASYESVIAILDVLKCEKNEKIVILGDILELGKHSKTIHKKIGKKLKQLKNSTILLVGSEVKYIKGKHYKYFNSNKELIDYLKKINLNSKTILIKGSRNMHLEEVDNFLKI
ncbi:MAG: UDP-N-acetylmuramoyl-tripeptide--D-alanyl-D-alanine ligase [Firmicutes bacterium]|nr:UDP-N-acetylmuramoyl-tripeptide--D-alanyl-D-alanine ligase [Bacillota bacterium]